MAKPTDGMVIESTPPADLGKVWLYRACQVIEAWESMPRELVTGSEQSFAAQRLDLVGAHGLSHEVDHEYEEDEWSLNNGKEGHDRVTYWSPGACEQADFEGLFHEWATLLDAIALALSDEDGDRAYELVRGRFDMAEKHGLTVEFTGMPVSGEKH